MSLSHCFNALSKYLLNFGVFSREKGKEIEGRIVTLMMRSRGNGD